MKKKIKWILVSVIVLASVAAYGAVLLAPSLVDAEQVVLSDLVHSFAVQGELVPEKSMVVNSSVSGQVTDIPCKPGLEVKAGAVLVTTDGTSDVAVTLQREQLNQQLAAARQEYQRLFGANGSAASAYIAAKSQYDLANRDYENGKSLAGAGGFLSQSDLLALKTKRDVAYEQLKQAEENNSETIRMYYEEQITSAQTQLSALSDTISPGQTLMPFDGVVWELYVENGAFLAQNQPVVKVYQEGNMKIEASLLSEDAAYLKEGQSAAVVYPDGSKDTGEVTFLSKVSSKQISSIGMEENRSVAELKPAAVPAGAGAGQKADLTFHVVVESAVITVPSAAIIPEGDGNIVYVIQDGKTTPVSVETGKKESGRVVILSGLQEGDVVTSDPLSDKLQKGSRVKAVYAD